MASEFSTKLEIVRQEAEKLFGSARGVVTCPPKGVPIQKLSADPRLLDYIYEVVFSSAPASSGLGMKGPGLESIRNLIFTLPDFKAASERVAYSEDLLTRAVSLLEGISRCPLCGSNNTTLSVRPVRSSDEAPSFMLYCGSCNRRTNQTGE